MISVVLDEEMVELFEGIAFLSGNFAPGVSLLNAGSGCAWLYEMNDKVVFRDGPEGMFQYDDEFTEWLKEHRPELFL